MTEEDVKRIGEMSRQLAADERERRKITPLSPGSAPAVEPVRKVDEERLPKLPRDLEEKAARLVPTKK